MHTDIRARLEAMAEPAYREFSSALIPGCRDMLGVRIPALRALARELSRGDWRALLSEEDRCFEERMLRGLLIASARLSDAERMEYIRSFVPQIGNWSVCDCFCSSLHCMGRSPDAYWPMLPQYLFSSEEYQVRFAAVSMLSHYLDTPYLPDVLRLLPAVTHEGYYARMAVAWALATAYPRDAAGVTDLLRAGSLDLQSHNLTIGKLIDSRRVPSGQKDALRALRRRA